MGRNLVHLLVSQNLVQYIKVADKGIPEMSYFHEKYMEAFQSPLVQYEQDDLTKLVYSSLHYIVCYLALAFIILNMIYIFILLLYY